MFLEAKNIFPDPYCHDIIRKARNLAQSKRQRLPSQLRRQYCHKCYHFLYPTKNCLVRLQGKCVVYTCQDCNNHNRFQFKE